MGSYHVSKLVDIGELKKATYPSGLTNKRNKKIAPRCWNTVRAERNNPNMTIITNVIKLVNNYFFGADEVNGDAFIFYGVALSFLIMTVLAIVLNIIY